MRKNRNQMAVGRGKAGAVVSVNLLPSSIQLRISARRRLQAWGLVLVAASLFVVFGAIAVRSVLYDDRELRSLIAREQDRIRLAQRAAARLAARADMIKRQAASLEGAQASANWARFIHDTANMLPDDAFLSRLEIVPIAKPATKKNAAATPEEFAVRLKGHASEFASIMQTYNQIQSSGFFSDVTFDRTEAAKPGADAAIEFAISCRR